MVVDNFSTDRTYEVAERLGLRVLQVRNPGFIEASSVMDAVQAAVQTDYLMIASCAEVVPPALLELYAAAANESKHDVVRAIRISITAGRPIDYRGNKVHDVGKITAHPDRVLTISRNRPDLFFFQFRDYDCSRTEIALCRYGDVLALQRHGSGEVFSLWRCLYRSFGHFALAYIKFGCFRFGMLGFLHSVYRGIMEFTIQLRIWEHQSGFTLSRVIELNTAEKAKLLSNVQDFRAKHDGATRQRHEDQL